MEGIEANAAKNRTDGVIIVPVYNEEKNVRRVIEEIRDSGIGWDIVAVEDGSRDTSKDILEGLPIILISHPVNLGYGAAIQTGLRYANKKGYETVVMMDSDGQHVPSEIPKLLRKLQEADIVIGSRFDEGVLSERIPFFRRVGIVFFSRLAGILCGTRIYDITSGFQAMRQDVARFLAEGYPIDFPDAEVIIALGLKKFRVVEVPVKFRQREYGVSMHSNPVRALYYPVKSLLASLIVVVRLIRKKR